MVPLIGDLVSYFHKQKQLQQLPATKKRETEATPSSSQTSYKDAAVNEIAE